MDPFRALPYTLLAKTYDDSVGRAFFRVHRRAFEAIVRLHAVRFGSAVDLGCGTGTFACYLSRCWDVPVFGIDRSPQMLAVAREKCDDAQVCFLRQNIQDFRLPCAVNLATCNFDTVNHLINPSHVKQMFRRVFLHLRPGGHFFFDLVMPTHNWRQGIAFVRKFWISRCVITQTVRWDPQTRLLLVAVLHRWKDRPRPTLELHQERSYTPSEIARWLTDAGLVVRGAYDAATLEVPLAWPIRLIVLAQKPARAGG